MIPKLFIKSFSIRSWEIFKIYIKICKQHRDMSTLKLPFTSLKKNNFAHLWVLLYPLQCSYLRGKELSAFHMASPYVAKKKKRVRSRGAWRIIPLRKHHGPRKPTFEEVFMVNNGFLGGQKPFLFTVLGANGS